jgi:enamine deaminase RidA (YjgF/YER057c/UK114 family)
MPQTTPSENLRRLGLVLPDPPRALGLYAPAVVAGPLVLTSGALPTEDGQLPAAGKVPQDVSVDRAAACARQAALNALAAAADAAGGLDRIARVLRLNVFVNSSAGFTAQPQVADGASRLLVEVFGESARPTRCALGAAELPLDAPVELDLICQLA